ncbi:Dual specificity protein phosphatase 4 [Porphyridium purpureum]|uniref:protein-tyrosine-phosphatase n=1 Tax=Porphyridium purpureum TaxID=35688 RepID=A0A5J4Z2B2_PORPP|nr:Dual specificity protein phosphatase 4 [Porphyridium purpureum]|eukprot:POR1952..scf295_1
MGVEDCPVVASHVVLDERPEIVTAQSAAAQQWGSRAGTSVGQGADAQLCVEAFEEHHGAIQAELQTKGVQRMSCEASQDAGCVLDTAGPALEHPTRSISPSASGTSLHTDVLSPVEASSESRVLAASRMGFRHGQKVFEDRLESTLFDGMAQHDASFWADCKTLRALSSSTSGVSSLTLSPSLDSTISGWRGRALLSDPGCDAKEGACHDTKEVDEERGDSTGHLLVQIAGISAQDLAQVFARKDPMILIDVRTRLLYHMEHIVGAQNINMLQEQVDASQVSAKGSEADNETLVRALIHFLKDTSAHRLNSQSSYEVVLYDHGGPDLSASFSRAAQLVWLLSERFEDGMSVSRISMLEGGFARFVQGFPDLCRKDATSSCATSNHGESLEKLLRSNLGKRLYAKLEGQNFFNVMGGTVSKASQILPYLYLGCQRDASDYEQLKALGITHVLVVGSELDTYFGKDKFVYKHLLARDALDEPIENLFSEACEFLEGIRKDEQSKVLVHCYAGVSRSATIAIAYLISLNYTLHAALELARERRSIICPNARFMRALCDWEVKVLGLSTKEELACDVLSWME